MQPKIVRTDLTPWIKRDGHWFHIEKAIQKSFLLLGFRIQNLHLHPQQQTPTPKTSAVAPIPKFGRIAMLCCIMRAWIEWKTGDCWNTKTRLDTTVTVTPLPGCFISWTSATTRTNLLGTRQVFNYTVNLIGIIICIGLRVVYKFMCESPTRVSKVKGRMRSWMSRGIVVAKYLNKSIKIRLQSYFEDTILLNLKLLLSSVPACLSSPVQDP